MTVFTVCYSDIWWVRMVTHVARCSSRRPSKKIEQVAACLSIFKLQFPHFSLSIPWCFAMYEVLRFIPWWHSPNGAVIVEIAIRHFYFYFPRFPTVNLSPRSIRLMCRGRRWTSVGDICSLHIFTIGPLSRFFFWAEFELNWTCWPVDSARFADWCQWVMWPRPHSTDGAYSVLPVGQSSGVCSDKLKTWALFISQFPFDDYLGVLTVFQRVPQASALLLALPFVYCCIIKQSLVTTERLFGRNSIKTWGLLKWSLSGWYNSPFWSMINEFKSQEQPFFFLVGL